MNNCEKFSIFIYKYEYAPPNSSLVVNIGDYIQSLAALQFLPKNCKPNLMDRDKIEYYSGPQTTLIMNCWLRLFNGTRTISDKISPIITSLHISNVKGIDLRTKNILKKFSPKGCRDYYTLNALKKNGIDAYFSSCLTTTLDIDYSVSDSERTNDIIFADYNFNYDRRIKKYLNSLKIYNFNNVTKTHHIYSKKISFYDGFKIAKKLLNIYAKAKLVITTRIHAALPCLAFNTPVIFVNKVYDIRYPGLYELLNTVGIDKNGRFNVNVYLNDKGLVENRKDYLKYANKLKENLRDINHINIKNINFE